MTCWDVSMLIHFAAGGFFFWCARAAMAKKIEEAYRDLKRENTKLKIRLEKKEKL